MDELVLLESVKGHIALHEFTAFYIRVTSLKSNLVYWNNRLGHVDPREREEAKAELIRCNNLLKKVVRDIEKQVQKSEN